ncbi:hypothetical protein DS884_14690 [Tenacibaculum sp. E3R01]|uniref:hypothetical protein n=1 Tax=Tenacibaculum sp. E3R01 TaxID=2267227 RepID=UPI000DE83D7E|nr:hypothetical protein [Tenacibaculum sp. E3R01]RBW56701.1 hypothetical protein DS884_14690 [Tenacibaculum sp. E3R01]
MGNQITTSGITLTLKDFKEFDTNIPAANKPKGPLVNISAIENGDNKPYTVTVLAYLPGNQVLNPLPAGSRTDLKMPNKEIYLNYYGPVTMNLVGRDGEPVSTLCRDFRVEFNCDDKDVQVYDLYYIQFTYQLDEGTPSVDAICVRDQDDDPETDRGTVTGPIDDED